MADQLLGSFVWCELMTTDTAGAESFYKKVVGWTAVPFAPDGSYTVFNNAAGAGAAGLMPRPANAPAPPNWLMYIGTPNVDDTAMRVAQLGGRVVKQPDNIPDTGRFAVVQDPYGATFGLFQPPPNRPGRGATGLGDFSWFELYTPNPEGAWKFYQTLFGWEKTSAMDMGEMGVYQMFGRGGGIPNGGIMKPPAGAPPAWMPYALVKDAKAAAAAATANGGTIINGPMEVPGGDWIAQGADPQGAMFAVHSLNPAIQAKPATPTAAKSAAAKKATSKKTAKKSVAKAKQVKKAKPTKKAAKASKVKTSKKKAAKKTVMRSATKTARKAAKKQKTTAKKSAKKSARRKK